MLQKNLNCFQKKFDRDTATYPTFDKYQAEEEDDSNDIFANLSSSSDDDDVIYMGEELPSKELQEKASELGLPRHFYNYLQKQQRDAENEDSDEEYQPEGSLQKIC